MLKIITIGSGSSGNGYIVTDGYTTIGLEAGIPVAKYPKHWLLGVQAVFITHEHQDHGGYAKQFNKRGIPVYATSGTLNNLKDIVDYWELDYGEVEIIGTLSIESVKVSHDAAEPSGFIIENGMGERMLFLTDLGTITKELEDIILQDYEIIAIECNYDRKTLYGNILDTFMIDRVDSDEGHLALEDLVKVLDKLENRPAILLLHMSGSNLSKEIVEEKMTVPYHYAVKGLALESGREVVVLS